MHKMRFIIHAYGMPFWNVYGKFGDEWREIAKLSWTAPRLTHAQLLAGGELVFEMGE